jgi:hypothetical protein
MSDLTKEFFEFLDWCDTRIFFEKKPSQWLKKDILLTVMIVLRSPTDVLSRIYSNYDTFVEHIRTLTINEDPVSHRGLTVTEEHFDKWNALCLETGTEEGMYMPAPRRSRFLKHFMNFMKALGLNTQKNYLLSRDFCISVELQRMTLEVVLQGNGHLIDVLAPNYREHITSLLPAT